jgi:VanZ family protein
MLHFADMRRASRNLLAWLPAVLWAGVIFALSAQPGSRLPSGWSVEGHLGVYAVLGVLVWLALGGRSAGLRGIVLAVVIASLYGITDEFHQSFVPQRTPDVRDWLTDTLGAAVAVAVAYYIAGRWQKRSGPRDAGSDSRDPTRRVEGSD